jgi:hypothetical protein
MLAMTISSVTTLQPVKPPEPSEAKPPEVKSDSDADAAREAASQRPVLAALPPGQGTRVDQLV